MSIAQRPYGKVAVAVHFLAAEHAQDRMPTERRVAETKDVVDVPAKRSVRKTGPPTILALEPDPFAAESLRTSLEEVGYLVLVVNTGKEALEYLRTNIPDAFIVEAETGDISGPDLCLIIKRDDRLARVPVVLLTHPDRAADNIESQKLGSVSCMAKPIQTDQLLVVIRSIAPPPASRFYKDELPENVVITRTSD